MNLAVRESVTVRCWMRRAVWGTTASSADVCKAVSVQRRSQFKSEINDAFPHKRHQKRHLDFWTAHLLSRGSPVRVWPGAPLNCRQRGELKMYWIADQAIFRCPVLDGAVSVINREASKTDTAAALAIQSGAASP